MKPETKLRILGYYLTAGAVLTCLGGYIIGFLPLVLIDHAFHLDLLEGSPYIIHPLAFLISTAALALYIWRDDEWKFISQAKRTGRPVQTTVRGYSIKYFPDGSRTYIAKMPFNY